MTPIMMSDLNGCMPQCLKWTIGIGVVVACVATAIIIGGPIAVGAAIGASVGAAAGMISGISHDENGFSYDWDKAATGFMLGSVVGCISGALGGGLTKIFEAGSYSIRGIMAGVDGVLSIGSYYAQTAINGETAAVGGALISFGSGLFNFGNPLNKVFDAIWSPIIGAEIAWGYDLIRQGLQKKRRLINY